MGNRIPCYPLSIPAKREGVARDILCMAWKWPKRGNGAEPRVCGAGESEGWNQKGNDADDVCAGNDVIRKIICEEKLLIL